MYDFYFMIKCSKEAAYFRPKINSESHNVYFKLKSSTLQSTIYMCSIFVKDEIRNSAHKIFYHASTGHEIAYVGKPMTLPQL